MATSFNEYQNPYIDGIYEQKKKAAAEALTAAYQQNMAGYDAQAKETSAAYGEQRNRTQAEYEQALKNFGEYSTAAGLNSGAQAQARIAYGARNQSGLSALGEGEASALAELSRARAATEAQHNAALAENEAAYDSDHFNALYAAYQDQVSQDKADRSYYYTLAMNALQTGNMPSGDTLAKAGIDSTTASQMASYYKGLRSASSGGSGGSGSSGGSGGLSGLSGIGDEDVGGDGGGGDGGGNNLPKATIPATAGTPGVAALSNNPYGEVMSMVPASASNPYSVVSGYINSGNLTAANTALAKYSSSLTTTQYRELLDRIKSKTTASPAVAQASGSGTSGGANGKYVSMIK